MSSAAYKPREDELVRGHVLLRERSSSHVRRTTRSPDTDCGTYRERIAQTYPELLFDLTEFSSALPEGETL